MRGIRNMYERSFITSAVQNTKRIVKPYLFRFMPFLSPKTIRSSRKHNIFQKIPLNFAIEETLVTAAALKILTSMV